MCYYDVSDIVKELGGMFFHHTSMMTTLQTSAVTVGCVMAAGDANLHGPATAASTHEGRRVQGLLLNREVQRSRRLHLHRAVERGFGRISGGWWPAGWRAIATHTSAKALAPLEGPWGCPPD